MKKRQEFPRSKEVKNETPTDHFPHSISVRLSSVDLQLFLSDSQSFGSGPEGLVHWSGRPGPGWVGPPPTGRVAGRRRRDSGARGAGAVFPGNVKRLSEIPAGRLRTEQTSHTDTAGTQAQLTGPSGWSAAGAARRAHTNPSRRPTNDTGTMRQCPRSPDTTTAQADKPQPIPMKPLRKTARIVKSLGSRHTVM